MSVLAKLTFENLKQNKRRTIFTVVGAALACALMLAVAGMVTSLQQTMIDASIASTGNYHEIYEDVPEEGKKYIENNINIDTYYYTGSRKWLDEDMEDVYLQNKHLVYSKSDVDFSGDEKDESRIFVRYKSVQNVDSVREQIIDVIKKETGININYRTNRQLILYEGGLTGEMMKEITIISLIIITIIVISSVFSIRNSFSISATERMRQFGMLSSIGATKRQIRKSVVLEGVIIGVISIPIGLLLGLIATAILVTVVTALIGDGLSVSMSFFVPWWIYPIIITISFITVLLSALFPAIRAAKIPPVEAIRGIREVKINPKKIHTSPLTRKFFGIGGVIASKNLKRAKRKYRTTVISIVVSVATFIGLSTFIQQAFGTAKIFYQQAGYDLIVTADDASIIEDIIQKYDMKEAVYYNNTAAYDKENKFEILVTNQKYFESFAKEIGVEGDLGKTVILYDYIFANKNTKKVLQHVTDIKAGDEVTIIANKKERQVQVTTVTEKAPLGNELSAIPILIISEEYAKKIDLGLPVDLNEGLNYIMFATTNDVEKIIDYIKEQSKTDRRYNNVSTQNIQESMRIMNNLYLLVAIFLYGFIIVITLIGITSVFNTISANMALRASEFASLKSVGMTNKEFNRMIRLESAMYSIKALMIGIPLGLFVSWGFYKAMSGNYDFGYDLPITAILISVLAVAILIWAIMRYSVKIVNKQNIIETIRSDTI